MVRSASSFSLSSPVMPFMRLFPSGYDPTFLCRPFVSFCVKTTERPLIGVIASMTAPGLPWASIGHQRIVKLTMLCGSSLALTLPRLSLTPPPPQALGLSGLAIVVPQPVIGEEFQAPTRAAKLWSIFCRLVQLARLPTTL